MVFIPIFRKFNPECLEFYVKKAHSCHVFMNGEKFEGFDLEGAVFEQLKNFIGILPYYQAKFDFPSASKTIKLPYVAGNSSTAGIFLSK